MQGLALDKADDEEKNAKKTSDPAGQAGV